MRNMVGQVPRGEDFFPRNDVVGLLYRRLDAGSNVFIAAPRRVGKTAVMRHLEDRPRENYEFIYMITESVTDAAAFFRQLLESLKTVRGITDRSLAAIGGILERIKTVKIVKFEVGLADKQAPDTLFFDEVKAVLRDLDTDGKTVVIMIDEFPQTVENIIRESGKGAGERFLQFNRELRQHGNKNIRFILTGSIGLPTIAEKLDATKEINDLNPVPIRPLKRDTAMIFAQKLLHSQDAKYEDDAIGYMLDKIEWLIPFYVQLMVQNLLDEYYETNCKIDTAMVDRAWAGIYEARNDTYFEHYYSRLKKTLDDTECPFALTLLDELAKKDRMPLGEIEKLARDRGLEKYAIVLRALNFDGYLFDFEENGEKYFQFTSPVLRTWWRNYVR